MIRNGTGCDAELERRWHYFVVKKLSALFRAITSKHYGNFFCLNCLYPFRTKNKLESHKRLWENKDFCIVIIPSEDSKILEFKQCQKSGKVPFIIHAGLECIIEKIDGCKINRENSSTEKVTEHVPSSFSMSTIFFFRSIENMHEV